MPIYNYSGGEALKHAVSTYYLLDVTWYTCHIHYASQTENPTMTVQIR